MSQDAIQSRLTALQSGHLPKLVFDFIVGDLRGVPPDEIESRITPEYLVDATRRAIEERPVAVQVRKRLVTSGAHCPIEEVKARTDFIRRATERLRGGNRIRPVAVVVHQEPDGRPHAHVIVQLEFPFTAGKMP